MAETAKAKQWVRVPWQLAAAFSLGKTRFYPPTDPRFAGVDTINYVYLVAPNAAAHNYGLAAPFPVRTVAFGSVPVTATVQLIQSRAADGLPEPLNVKQNTDNFRGLPPGKDQVFRDAELEGELTVRITELTVDGVRLNLNAQCQTVRPGTIELTGVGYARFPPTVDDDRPWLTGNYVAVPGGLLTGTIDIPKFGGCTTRRGDDVSAILNATVSGNDNQVRLNVSGPACGSPQVPPPPGAASPDDEGANCDTSRFPPQLPYPDRTP
ncbi:hypothetical protein [Aeromicrobium sp. P5_D10]